VKVAISEACVGHGRCYQLFPQVFEYDEEGYGVVLNDGDVDPALREQAVTAVGACPEGAVRFLDTGA
jgi:ferredoxin